jgi:CheY-like chemotaxis protein
MAFSFWPFRHRTVAPAAPVAPDRPRLLIVEEDPQAQALLHGFLWELGFATHFVSDGAALLRVLELSRSLPSLAPGRFDLVMADVEAPRRSGLDILVTVRRNGWRTPVVLTSPFVSSMLRAEVIRMGAVAILRKPICLQELELVLQGMTFPGASSDQSPSA